MLVGLSVALKRVFSCFLDLIHAIFLITVMVIWWKYKTYETYKMFLFDNQISPKEA